MALLKVQNAKLTSGIIMPLCNDELSFMTGATPPAADDYSWG